MMPGKEAGFTEICPYCRAVEILKPYKHLSHKESCREKKGHDGECQPFAIECGNPTKTSENK